MKIHRRHSLHSCRQVNFARPLPSRSFIRKHGASFRWCAAGVRSVFNGIKRSERSFCRRRRLIGCSGAEIAYLVVMGCIKVGRSLTHTSQAAACGLFIKSSTRRQADEGQRVAPSRLADGYDEWLRRQNDAEVLHHMLLMDSQPRLTAGGWPHGVALYLSHPLLPWLRERQPLITTLS